MDRHFIEDETGKRVDLADLSPTVVAYLVSIGTPIITEGDPEE